MTSAPALPIARSAAPVVAMMPAYLHELTPGGPASYPRLAAWWRDPDRMPHLIEEDGADVGFALVRAHRAEGFHEMVEFYVRPARRREGVGARAARALFARYPGAWCLQVLDSNAEGNAFWRRVAPGPVHVEARRSDQGRAYALLQFFA